LLLFLIWNSFSQNALNRRRRLWYNEIGNIWKKAVTTNAKAYSHSSDNNHGKLPRIPSFWVKN
jgi:hypothetical protein